jgi:hypothetical protein
VEFLRATQMYSDARTLQMLIKAEPVIKNLTAEYWERLACVQSALYWKSRRCLQDNYVEKYRRWKILYREFLEGVRLRAGFNPVLAHLKWRFGDPTNEWDELSEEDGDEESDHDSDTEEEKEEGESEQNDEEDFKDAVEYLDG